MLTFLFVMIFCVIFLTFHVFPLFYFILLRKRPSVTTVVGRTTGWGEGQSWLRRGQNYLPVLDRSCPAVASPSANSIAPFF